MLAYQQMKLAALLISFVTPFLPHLLKLGQPVAEAAGKELGEKVGEGSWVKATQVWGVLWPRVKEKPLVQGAVTAIAKDTQDEDAKAILTQQLEKVFTVDSTLAQTLESILSHESAVAFGLVSIVLPAAQLINQSVTRDLNRVVCRTDSATIDQSNRYLEIGGDAQSNTIFVGDGNTFQVAPQPAREQNPFGVPYVRNRYFAGREAVLLQLHEQLTQSGTAFMTQVRAISGLGGIGKTQTAVEYAYRYHYGQAVYKNVFWVNADTEVNLASDYAAIAEQVAVPKAQTLSQDHKIAAVRTWLNTHHNWLLVFDNADHPDWLSTWMPTNPNGKVLITSRASFFDQLSIQTPIILDVLSEAEALMLLFEHTDIPRTETSENEAIALNQALDGLPLALEQARAYIARQKIGFGDYLRAYRYKGLTQLEKTKAQTGRYPSSVLNTWRLNMVAVSTENPAAIALLELSAFLAPDEIPECILIAGAAYLGARLIDYLQSHERNEDERDEAVSLALHELLALLSRYSLVRWSIDPSTYSVHRLVQAVVRDQIAVADAADCLTQAITAIAYAYPGKAFKHWPLCRQLLPHWLRIVEQAEVIGHRSEALGLVCNQAGVFLNGQGRYKEAEPLFQSALEIRKTALGKYHPDTADTIHNLALLYRSQGRYEEAEPLCQSALEIRKTALGEIHPDTVHSLGSLALLYRSQGRYEEAEPLFQSALEIRRTALGNLHPDTATSLNNLALLYESQERYEEAEPLFQSALEIRRTALGNLHPYTADSLGNLAFLYRSQGRYEEAEPLCQSALEISKITLGDSHPNTAHSLHNLALLYESQGRYEEAEPLFQSALEIRRTALGNLHPYTATSFNNLALLYESQGRYEEAEPLYKSALEICTTVLGEYHPDTADSLYNLAALYYQTQRSRQSLNYFQKALVVYIPTLGHNHPVTQLISSWIQLLEQVLSEQDVQ